MRLRYFEEKIETIEQTADHVLTVCLIPTLRTHETGGCRFLLTKFDAGSTLSLPASDPGSRLQQPGIIKEKTVGSIVLFVSDPE